MPIYLSPTPRIQSAHPGATGSIEVNAGSVRPSAQRQVSLLPALLLTLQSTVTSSVSVNLLDMLKQLGIATAKALAIAMVMGSAQVAGHVAQFTWSQGLHPPGPPLGCSALPGRNRPAATAFVTIALYGADNGILTITRGALPLVLFGPVGYGARMGLLARPMLVAQAPGPIGAAATLETSSEDTLLLLLAGVALAGSLSSWLLPVRTADA